MSKPSAEPVQAAPDESRLFRFRLVHIVYVITLLASSLATFGLGGILPGALVVTFWASVFTSRSRPKALLHACLVTLLCSCLISCLLPAVQTAREASRRMQCSNNLKQIALALHNYHDLYGSFPPAYFADENGKPKHSWRVLLLPFLEQQPLYDKYDFDEPWNGPNNSKLLNSMPPEYSCPSAARNARVRGTCTSYVAVVGPTTAWPGQSARTFTEFTDGLAETVLVIEYDNPIIPWLEPSDLELSAALELLDSSDPEAAGAHRNEDFFYQYFTGRNVALADGSIRFVRHGIDRRIWSALLGTDDGIVWDDSDFEGLPKIAKRLKVGNCLRLALFVVLIFFPLPWVWLNPTSATTGTLRSASN